MAVSTWTRLVRALIAIFIIGTTFFGSVGRVMAGANCYVRAGALGANNGSSWADAYTTLSAALANSACSPEIWVAAGIYTPGGTRLTSFDLKSGVAIYGGFSGTETALTQRDWVANPTVLSGDIGNIADSSDNTYHVVHAVSVTGATLDGFIIRGGNANSGSSPYNIGGGMYLESSTPTLSNLTFIDNQAAIGGGLANALDVPDLTNITFRNNSATDMGGALYNFGTPINITGATFDSNNAWNEGGGIYNQGRIILANVSFLGNWATNGGGIYSYNGSMDLDSVTLTGNWASSSGGGIYQDSASAGSLTAVTFRWNAATNGGGMYNSVSSPTLDNVTFDSNQAISHGGGMYNGSASDAQLTNVTFHNNSAGTGGGGMYNNGSGPSLFNVTFNGNLAVSGAGSYDSNSTAVFKNVTFSGNIAQSEGGALYADTGTNSQIYNSILYGDTPDEYADDSSISGNVVKDSIVQDDCNITAWTCTNILTGDPLLGPLQNNTGLTSTMAPGAGSPAIDAGGTDEPCTTADQRGVTRPQGFFCDIGAYEVRATKYTSNATQDGYVTEASPGAKVGGLANSTGKALFVGDDSSRDQYRAILSFNTASLPNTATVIGALVVLQQQAIKGSPLLGLGTLNIDVKRGTFDTASLLPGDFQAKPTVASGGSVSLVPNGILYTGTLTAAGRKQVSRTGVTQLRLQFSKPTDKDHQADYVSFFSGNALSTSRPVLWVYYNP